MRSIAAETVQSQVRVNSFIRSVYNWMGIGLALTGFVAYYVAHNETLLRLVYANTMVLFGLIIAELGLVFYLSARIQRIQASTATGLFLFYAFLNGVTLSWIFMVYTGASIANVFFICAATFIAASIYGMVTKRDLTAMGSFLFMGLIGIIIASVINGFFIKSSGMQMIISYIGVLVFVGLTVYDTNKLKAMALSQPEGLDGAVVRKGAILGALSLYLDFINLFIMLLHIFGNRE